MVTFSDEVYDYNEESYGPISQMDPTRPNRAVVVVPNMAIPDAVIATIDTAPHLSVYMAINITFVKHEVWKNYISVKAYMRKTRRVKGLPDLDLCDAEFKFDRDCIKPVDATISPVNKDETAYLHYGPFKALIEKHQLWKLTIKYQPKQVHKGSLLTNTYSGRDYDPLNRLYHYLNGHQDIQFLVKGGDHVEKQFHTWLDQFQHEDLQLDRWYPDHPGSYFIQEGEYPKPSDRPVVYLQQTSTFSNKQEYNTVIGFGTIQEEEHNKRAVDAIGET